MKRIVVWDSENNRYLICNYFEPVENTFNAKVIAQASELSVALEIQRALSDG